MGQVAFHIPDVLFHCCKIFEAGAVLAHISQCIAPWFLDSAQCCCRCERNQRVKARCVIIRLPGFLLFCFKRGSGWLAFPGRRLLYFFCTAQFAPASLLALTAPLKRQNLLVPYWLEPTAAGLRPSSNSQLLENMLWGQAGAFQQLYAMLSESRNKQVQTLLLDFGNCCLRDRFAYKYPLFSLWIFTREAGAKRDLCFSRICLPLLLLLLLPT